MNSIHNHLDFLNQLLFNNGVDVLLNDFYNNQIILNNGYDYFTEHGYYIKFDMIEDGEDAQFSHDIITQEIFVNKYLNNKFYEIFNFINNLKVSEDKKYLENLNSTYSELLIYYKRVSILEDDFFKIIKSYIIKTIEDLRIKFPEVKYHNSFKILLSINDGNSVFQPKELKYTFFKELYKTTYLLNLIDDVVVSEEMFIDVLTSPKSDDESKITFIVKNHLIAIYLKEIETFFYNLTPITIEKNEGFINKSGKPINSTDIYTAISRNKNKNLDMIDKIVNSIQLLKDKYLV